ncbi:P-loop NTPase family protein [Chryseobacterium wangxinyae]|uniref:hypothetical protein n=1 Tax=Chryseobacterium sp. CY353 TaxID=2997334 RepID=UPI00226E4BAD|nr:hypothetical protein [Chryseobacterium sp. CY353]MCY0970275.1 hypothetical protein [Chryseobacterium sp. CY353]
MNETQIIKVLAKARELNVIIDKDLATKALEIKDSAASAENKKLLDRLISSLEQYIAKEQNLVYIGFVGHFSSGKSSTINNVLNISGGSDERPTDLNPTDTNITLITDKSNSAKIIHMSKESVYVPVRTITIESNFLNDLVIADTPGSGDPNIANELIQDFLPICDYIFYFISAANPIDQADIPLLRQKNQKLPFIPLYFVVTRSDEFKLIGEQPLSEENLNVSKKDNFTGQLMSRLKEFAAAEKLSEDDFIFIDNRDKYNIDELTEKIRSWSTELDQTSLWNNHSHKLDFYSRNFNELETFFLNTIKDKIKVTGDFLKTAGENIHKFDAAVEVNNEKLRNVWTEGERKLNRGLQDEHDQLDSTIKAKILGALSNTEEMVLQDKIIATFIENQSNGNIGRFTSELYNLIKSRILIVKQDIGNTIDNRDTDFVIEDIKTILPPRIDLSGIDEKLELDFSKMDTHVITYLNRLYGLADGLRIGTIERSDLFVSMLHKQQIINALDDVYKRGADTISENFDKYFDVIAMYKQSVLTKNTKDTIQKLRIGKQLDDLDDDFPEQYKITKKEEAISAIYKKKDEKIFQLKSNINEIEDKLLELRRQLSSNDIRRNSAINNFFGKEEFRIVDVLNEATTSIEGEINKLYQEKLLRSFEDHREAFLIYNAQKQKQKSIRKNAIIKWTLIPTFCVLVFYIMLLELNMITPTAVFWTIGFGLLSSGISAVLGNLWAKFKNDLTKMTEHHRESFQKKSVERLKSTFNDDFFNALNLSVAEARPKKLPSLEKIYKEKLLTVTQPANTDITQILIGLNNKNSILIAESAKYLNLVSEFHSIFNSIFSNQDENIIKIRLITQEIKQKSIEPSFILLESTQSDLEHVKMEIESIKVELEISEKI